MREQDLSQAELAKRAKVDQSTVSRALKGQPIRRGAAKARLYRLAKINAYAELSDAGRGRQHVLAAFERIWDYSEEHAEAIAKVIEATSGLRMRKRKDR